MKAKGKAPETSSWFSDSNPPCKKHPFSTQPSVGICAFCLKDRLIKLVCSDCGEQRLSSCSCSDISSSNRNSCAVEVGSVGRISFLIENEKSEPENPVNPSISGPPTEKSDAIVLLRRSNSSSVSVSNNGNLNSGKNPRFWNLGWFLRKKYEENSGFSQMGDEDNGCGKIGDGSDRKNETWVLDFLGLSRSRSVGGFRSGFSDSGPGFDGLRGGFSASDSGFDGSRGGLSSINRGLRESQSSFGDSKVRLTDPEPSSGDMKISLSESEPCLGDLTIELSGLETGLNAPKGGFSGSKPGLFGDRNKNRSFHSKVLGPGMFSNGGSCRVTVDDEWIKKSKKSLKVWKWVFRHSRRKNSEKKSEKLSADPDS